MAFYYHAFGLTFQSNKPLPWLPEKPNHSEVDIRIKFDVFPLNTKGGHDEIIRAKLPGPSSSSAPQLTILEETSDSRFRFRYRDGTEFIITADGKKISAAWPQNFTIEEAATYLLGPITGFALRLHGIVCLHASAVSDTDGALAFVAPAGFGKSSTAAFFAKKGYAVLTDDILAFRETETGFEVLPGWPHLRLWPSSVTALFGKPNTLPRLCPASANWDKCYLDLTDPGFQFQAEPMPMKVIYSAQFDSASSGVRVKPMGQMQALRQLLADTYSWYSLDGAMRAAELDCLTRFVQQVPVRSLTICDSKTQGLERQCRAILEDAAAEGFENRLAAEPMT